MTGDLQVAERSGVAHLLPNFIVIGAMKAGTTSLYHYLKDHHQVFMPRFKELDFFVEESNWSRGVGWYGRQFSEAGAAVARGEASTSYTQYPVHDGVPERIARLLPGVRLIYVVRDPVERIRSHYQHLVMTGVEKSPPEVALFENPVYLACSRYATQLERYLEHFPREQILVVTSEGLKHDRRTTVREVYDFLDVDAGCLPEALDTEFYRTDARPTYPPVVLWARRLAIRHKLRAELARTFAERLLARRPDREEQVLGRQLRAQLSDLLSEDVARLRRYMPDDFDGWGYA